MRVPQNEHNGADEAETKANELEHEEPNRKNTIRRIGKKTQKIEMLLPMTLRKTKRMTTKKTRSMKMEEHVSRLYSENSRSD